MRSLSTAITPKTPRFSIDKEVRSIVTSGYDRAHTILDTYRDALERVAQALLDREVLDAVELKLLIEGKPLPG